MARPAGKRLNGGAFRDLLRIKGLSMTEAADRCGIALTTLSGLVKGRHNASDKVIRQLQEGLELTYGGTLFPDLAGWVYPADADELEDVA